MAIDVSKLVDWDAMGDDLAGMMKSYHLQLFQVGYDEAGNVMGETLDFDANNPNIRKAQGRLAKKIRDVSDTTRAEIERLAAKGAEEGWSTTQLADAILEHADIVSESRALNIARTETSVAANTGSVLAYGEAGVTKVEVLDGDEDEECAAANGQTWTLDEAEANPIAHPNCQRTFVPVIE